MIKLNKIEKPDVLKANDETWLEVLQTKIAAGETPSEQDKGRYRHVEIKEALIKETHGKCAYCESFVRHIAFGDIEHIHPKSASIEDTFRWENLTLACDMCNTHKGSVEGIIDPYIDEPNDHFNFLGPMIVARSESAKAVISERRLKLNRGDLLLKRAERLSAVSTILLLLSKVKDADERSAIRDDLFANELADGTEYSAFAKAFVEEIFGEGGEERVLNDNH